MPTNQEMVVVVLRSPIHANEPSEYNGMLYRTSNRVLNNGIKVIILICMDGTSQYHHHPRNEQTQITRPLSHIPGGFLDKGLSVDVPLKWVSKSASWYNDDPLFSAKTGINMGHIFKIYQFNWHENRPNFINLIQKFPKFA